MISSFFKRRNKSSFLGRELFSPESTSSISCREALTALVPGDEEEGYRILHRFQTQETGIVSAPIASKHLLHAHIAPQHKEPLLYAHDLSFSWLAHLGSISLQKQNHIVVHKISELLFHRCMQQINNTGEHGSISAPKNLKETYTRLLRIVHIWVYSNICAAHPHIRNQMLMLSLKDLVSLDLKMLDSHQSLPVFARLNIYMLLTVFEQTLLDAHKLSFADPYLAKLSEHYGEIISHLQHPTIKDWIAYIKCHKDARVNNLSSSFGTCFDEKNGVALFSRDPVVHAHLFLWFYATHKILTQYGIVHHTLDDRLKKLCALLSEFYIDQGDIKQNADLGFLTMQRFSQSLYNIPLIFPPHSESLVKFIRLAMRESMYEAVESDAMGFRFAKTPRFAVQICVQTPQSEHENYLLSPLSLFVYSGRFSRSDQFSRLDMKKRITSNFSRNTKKKHPEFPIFCHPRHPFPEKDPLFYLQQTGIGIHSTIGKTGYLDEMIENISSIDFSNSTLASYRQDIITRYPEMYEKDTQIITAGFQLLSEDIAIIRHILTAKKKNIIFGLDMMISTSATPRQRHLNFHISFYCPQAWIVQPVENSCAWLLKKSGNTRKFIFRTQSSSTSSSWKMVEHRGKGHGHWIYYTQSMPHQGKTEVAWSLSNAGSIEKRRRTNLAQFPQLT